MLNMFNINNWYKKCKPANNNTGTLSSIVRGLEEKWYKFASKLFDGQPNTFPKVPEKEKIKCKRKPDRMISLDFVNLLPTKENKCPHRGYDRDTVYCNMPRQQKNVNSVQNKCQDYRARREACCNFHKVYNGCDVFNETHKLGYNPHQHVQGNCNCNCNCNLKQNYRDNKYQNNQRVHYSLHRLSRKRKPDEYIIETEESDSEDDYEKHQLNRLKYVRNKPRKFDLQPSDSLSSISSEDIEIKNLRHCQDFAYKQMHGPRSVKDMNSKLARYMYEVMENEPVTNFIYKINFYRNPCLAQSIDQKFVSRSKPRCNQYCPKRFNKYQDYLNPYWKQIWSDTIDDCDDEPINNAALFSSLTDTLIGSCTSETDWPTKKPIRDGSISIKSYHYEGPHYDEKPKERRYSRTRRSRKRFSQKSLDNRSLYSNFQQDKNKKLEIDNISEKGRAGEGKGNGDKNGSFGKSMIHSREGSLPKDKRLTKIKKKSLYDYDSDDHISMCTWVDVEIPDEYDWFDTFHEGTNYFKQMPTEHHFFPVLYHKPFDRDDPGSYRKRDPNQLRPSYDSNFLTGVTYRYTPYDELIGLDIPELHKKRLIQQPSRISHVNFGYDFLERPSDFLRKYSIGSGRNQRLHITRSLIRSNFPTRKSLLPRIELKNGRVSIINQ